LPQGIDRSPDRFGAVTTLRGKQPNLDEFFDEPTVPSADGAMPDSPTA